MVGINFNTECLFGPVHSSSDKLAGNYLQDKFIVLLFYWLADNWPTNEITDWVFISFYYSIRWRITGRPMRLQIFVLQISNTNCLVFLFRFESQ
nr:hypothetical protein [Rickettsia endosymbiont of Ceutorhynchus assimilis]